MKNICRSHCEHKQGMEIFTLKCFAKSLAVLHFIVLKSCIALNTKKDNVQYIF